ncbi:hypothetical protein CLOM_g20430 [Closterium sp. NIES-68]|nr:hypothetical protein CLOM_g20430 [Closterium sp. NIES-68]
MNERGGDDNGRGAVPEKTSEPPPSKVEALDGSNYEEWSGRMRSAFKRYKLLKIAVGKEKMPEEGEARERWIEKNAVLFDLILQSQDQWTPEWLRQQILQEDFRRRHVGGGASTKTAEGYGAAGRGRGRGGWRGRGRGRSFGRGRGRGDYNEGHGSSSGRGSTRMEGTCWYCKKVGHPWFKCFSRPEGWAPPGMKPPSGERAQGGAVQGSGAQGEGAQGNTYPGMFLMVEDVHGHEGDVGSVGKVVMHPLTHQVIDSGCTSHMTPRADLLDEVKPPGKIKYVAAASGALLPVIGVGNAKVKGANGELVGLGNVLLVEGLSANLLSVRRLQKSKAEVTFGPTSCRAKLGKKVLWSLEEETSCIKDFWQLPIIPWNGKTPTAATALAAKATAGGDATAPTDGVLEAVKKKLVKDGSLKGLEVKGGVKEIGSCPTCLETKFSKFPFNSTTGPAKTPLALVHMDVVGPTRAPSLSGSRYFLTIVDDHTRAVWVCPLKSKGEVAVAVLKEWMPRAQRECGHKVKVIRSDNGGEFIGADFEGELKRKGIQHQLTRPRRDVRPPVRLTYGGRGKLNVVQAGSVVEQIEEDDIAHCYWAPIPEPKTREEALNGPNGEKWKASEDEEFGSLIENETWDLCDLPPGKKAITSKMIYRHKYGPEGELTRYKSRLVARGFQQTKGKDYDEVFAPVGKGTTLRVLLAIAALLGWKIRQMDIVTAFLNGIILEEVAEQMLEMQFKCSKMGEVKYYLGMHVERDVEKGVLRLHQRKYCEGLAEKYGLQDGGKPATPLPSGFTVEPCADEEVVGEMKADGTSIGGYVCLLGGGAVSWRRKKQNEVGLSSYPHRPFELITDASDLAVGVVLLQDFGEGLQPIAYESRKLNPAERNYPVHEKELLAIVHAFKVWHCYLTGADVTV